MTRSHSMPRRRALAQTCLVLLAGCAADTSVSPADTSAYEVSVATHGTGAGIAWYGGGQPEGVFFEQLSAAGRPVAAPVRVSDPRRSGYEPDMKFAGNVPILGWYEKARDKALTAWIAWLDRDGRPTRKVRLDGAGGWARNPVVRVARGIVHVAWIETADAGKGHAEIWYRRFDRRGGALDAPRRVGAASTHTWNLNAAVDPQDRFHIAYDSDVATRASEARLLTVEGSSVRTQLLTPDDGAPSLYPDVGIGPGGELALAWFDARDGNTEIYAAVLPPGPMLSAPLARARRLTHTPGASIGAYLAWRGNRVTIVWSDADSGRYELYATSLDRTGRMLGSPEQLTRVRDNAGIPSLAATGDALLVGWNDYARSEAGHDPDRVSTAHVLRID